MIRPKASQETLTAPAQDQLRIYFVSKDNLAWPPGSVGASYPAQEKGFSIDWRGCGAIITASAGYSAAALDLHRFAGHSTAMIVLPSEQFRLWHDNLREAFMPKAGGYAIDDITRHIGETSRLLVRQQIPADLQARFTPRAEIDLWYGDSQVHDPKYLPQVMCRAATPDEVKAGTFSEGITWFAADGADAHIVGKGPELPEAIVRIEKPLTLATGTSIKEAMATMLIPGGYDGIIIRDEAGACVATAVASPEQFRLAGTDHPDVECWLESWLSLRPIWPPAPAPAPDIDEPTLR